MCVDGPSPFRHRPTTTGSSLSYCLGGAVTARLTVGPVFVELTLLETTPFESTPTMVNVYEFAGVIPFGVEVRFVVLPHAGISRTDALTTKIASKPEAFRARFPPVAAPTPTSPSSGIGSHRP